MMWFWKSWDKESKIIYLTSLVILCGVIATTIWLFFLGIHYPFGWHTISNIEQIPVTIDSIYKGLLTIPVTADINITFREYTGAMLEPNVYYLYIAIGVTYLFLILALTTFSFLNNWLYYIGTFIVMCYYIFQQPASLIVGFQLYMYVQIVPILLLGGISYYFFAFHKGAGFLLRFIVIALINGVYLGIISTYSTYQYPIFMLHSYAIFVPCVIAIAFIFFVSFEIVYSFLLILSSSKSAGNQQEGIHFGFIFLLYFINLLLQQLHNMKIIDLPLFYIPPIFFLVISTLLGIWGIRERSVMFQRILPFYPFGAVIYLCWAAICYATISYFYISANDSAIELIDDAILYSHIGMGLGFFLYVWVNYTRWIDSGYKVHKMVYTFQWVSFLSVYGIGLVVALTLFLYQNMFPYKQAFAAYYNTLGDIYVFENQYDISEQYYMEAFGYEFQNHKSNYALAALYLARQDVISALDHYKKSIIKQPSEQAYTNLSRVHSMMNHTFEAIFALTDGLKKYPNSYILCNNLAILYQKMGFRDSCIYYLQKSEKLATDTDKEIPLSNLLAYGVKNNISFANAEMYYSQIAKSKDYITHANALAYTYINPQIKPLLPLKSDTKAVLNDDKMAYVTNYTFYQNTHPDTSWTAFIDTLKASDTTYSHTLDLTYLGAVAGYYSGKVAKAMKSIDELQITSEATAGKYLHTLALWNLQNNVPNMAAKIFQMAADKGHKEAKIYKTVSLLEAGRLKEAILYIQSENLDKDSTCQEVLNSINLIFSYKKPEMALLTNDLEKYNYLHYRMHEVNDVMKGNFFFSIQDDVYKMKTGIDLFDYYFAADNMTRCSELMEAMASLNTDKNLKDSYNRCMMLYFYKTHDQAQLSQIINKSLHPRDEYARYLAKAHLAKTNNDTSLALKYYGQAFRENPLNEYNVLECAQYYSACQLHNQSFNMLLDGITLNPDAKKISMEYCMEALRYGIPGFAQSGLAKVKQLTSNKEYDTFMALYLIEKDKLFGMIE